LEFDSGFSLLELLSWNCVPSNLDCVGRSLGDPAAESLRSLFGFADVYRNAIAFAKRLFPFLLPWESEWWKDSVFVLDVGIRHRFLRWL